MVSKSCADLIISSDFHKSLDHRKIIYKGCADHDLTVNSDFHKSLDHRKIISKGCAD